MGRLARLVNIAVEMRPAPAFVVASGDLVNRGDQRSYRMLAGMLAKLPCPVICALGNHDRRAPFREVFSGHPGAPDAPLDHDRVEAGVHLVVLDSSIPGRVEGTLDEGQFDFLEAALARHPDLPKLVVVHHPPKMAAGGRLRWATLGDAVSARFRDLLTGHRVAGVLSGHVHYNRVSLWHGIPVVTAVGHQASVDLTRPGGLTVIEGAGFVVGDLLPGGLSVSFVPLDPPVVLKEVSEARLKTLG